ncbi:flagellar FlbD family protein [Liquorilactobacillus mali]|uniref:Flagellar protein FlbD n=1 Tax=Liquorilactobacillus mali KCTC 3596 = DSM 20444 TaxID=1046596 RepID=J0UV56_9LACO|nr:flagellar FlbD family protein [Liquorilactobacillus mali]AJA34105.1 flagellar protein FlbD [Liquorilactobacillus mali KCTC 3596 = DSM 20444]EJF02204.1 flagellar protein FlbD [Liquorilactobacillus mali KCTC 3596 = DSM 20444]MDC7953967.1 flagellar FlbD family protein [Liquorilactobacillus mali]MDV7757464.1 flagellar protein FlbD [Liquorilactobacillus mali]QFQ75623.1 flagellar FlbD family protein [Liquorilactobacillus mali]
MIELVGLNGRTFFLNADLILKIEETPDTIITLVDDRNIIVKNKAVEIKELIIEYRRKILADSQNLDSINKEG